MARNYFCYCYCFISASIVLFTITTIIFAIVVHPVNVKFHVVNASLSEFNFITNTTTIVYNLSIEARVRNPNKKIGYYYHRIDAKAFYERRQFAYMILSDRFYQGHKNTTMLHILFHGNSSIPLRGFKLEGFSRKFDKAKSEGAFNIYIRFGVRSRYKIGHYKSSYSKPKIYCGLRIPLLTNGASTVFFRTTTCDVGSPLAMDDGEE